MFIVKWLLIKSTTTENLFYTRKPRIFYSEAFRLIC